MAHSIVHTSAPSRAVEHRQLWSLLLSSEQERVCRLAIELKQSGLIVDRRQLLTTHKNVFVGCEAIDWMLKKNLATDRAEAKMLGQHLITGNFVHHVQDQHEFEDKHYFYRFFSDDKVQAGPSVASLLADATMEGWLTIKKRKPSVRVKKQYCVLTARGAFHILFYFASDVSANPVGFIKFERNKFSVQYLGRPLRQKYSFQLIASAANGRAIALTATATSWPDLERWVEAFVQAGASFVDNEHPSSVCSASIFEFTCFDIAGRPLCFDRFRGKVVLITIIAAQSESTALQLTQLQRLHDDYHDQGLEIVAFPCHHGLLMLRGNSKTTAASALAASASVVSSGSSSSFSATDSRAAVASSLQASTAEVMLAVREWNVRFIIMDQVVLNGPGSPPLFAYLKHAQPGAGGPYIQGYFTKFLVSRGGQPAHRGESTDEPFGLRAEIIRLLGTTSAAAKGASTVSLPVTSPSMRSCSQLETRRSLRDSGSVVSRGVSPVAASQLLRLASCKESASQVPMTAHPPPAYVPGRKLQLARLPRPSHGVYENVPSSQYDDDCVEFDHDDGWDYGHILRPKTRTRDGSARSTDSGKGNSIHSQGRPTTRPVSGKLGAPLVPPPRDASLLTLQPPAGARRSLAELQLPQQTTATGLEHWTQSPSISCDKSQSWAWSDQPKHQRIHRSFMRVGQTLRSTIV